MPNQCEDYLCIYYEKEHCTLEYITLNHMGMCMNNVHVYLDNKEFEKIRKQQLEQIKNSIKNMFNVK